MYSFIVSLIYIALIGYAIGKDQNDSTTTAVSHREGKFFPFYTIGRFEKTVCTGSNTLTGTCIVGGECDDAAGYSAGTCNSNTKQAICCIIQKSCGMSTMYNNTYFYNPSYPAAYAGGGSCSISVKRCNSGICQLRLDFLDFSLAPPTGDGFCLTDYISITGGSSRVPRICGENLGQHVYIDFNGDAAITVTVWTTSATTFNRRWNIGLAQIGCDSEYKAPSGCLQYYLDATGTVMSFNYGSTASALTTVNGVTGSRQIANLQYGICVRMAAGQCTITWSQTSGDMFSFTVTGDVSTVDPTLLGTGAVQSTTCTTDYVIIPNPTQAGLAVGSDRFCGMGLNPTTSNIKPFVLYVVDNGNETPDIANRGFQLSYVQNACPV